MWIGTAGELSVLPVNRVCIHIPPGVSYGAVKSVYEQGEIKCVAEPSALDAAKSPGVAAECMSNKFSLVCQKISVATAVNLAI